MTLLDLLTIIDASESTELIQICEPDGDWEDFCTFHAWSELLKPFHQMKIVTMAAISEDVFRVQLEGEKDA